MLLILLLLSYTGDSFAERVFGKTKDGSCVCPVNGSVWIFPALKYESVLQQVQDCETSMNNLQAQVRMSSERLPQMQALIQNLTARLEPYQYLNDKGLYAALALRQLGQELKQLETDISSIHTERQSAETQKLSTEVSKLLGDVNRMRMSNTVNMKTVKEKLRYLKNSVESCKSIPKDFRSQQHFCFKGLMSNISSPVVTKISPYGKSYISGSWGQQAQENSLEEPGSYWIQPLVSSNAWGNTLRLYSSHQDFMASANHRDFSFAPSSTHINAIEGPSMVLYGDAVYYHCYRSSDICRYSLTDKTVKRVTLPDFVKDKFLYCYYDCRTYSDMDLEADETGLWVIYGTFGNHGNLVVSRVDWDGEELNITHTWETRLFKRAATNAFMACGVLYATRYVDDYNEEVFYAFDTATGKEDTTLALPLEKVAKGVASLSYNPVERMIYMYNDAYLLAYEAKF